MSDPLWEQAGRLHASRLFKTTNTEHAYAVILAGQELGLGPTTALANISVIQGKPSLGAALVGALIKRSGRYDYRVTYLDDLRAEVRFYQHKPGSLAAPGLVWEEIGVSTFSLEDARKAGLGGSQTWKSYPRNLLLSRALTNGARWFVPDVTAGALYDPSELEPAPAPATAPSGVVLAQPDGGNVASAGPHTRAGYPGETVTLEALLDRYGAEAITAATGGGIPATAEEVAAVAERLAASQAPGADLTTDPPAETPAQPRVPTPERQAVGRGGE